MQARDSPTASTARVWMKSAIVEREAGDLAAERALLTEGLRRFPSFWKMWLMLGQLEHQEGRIEACRTAYANGLKRCADCIPLWRAAARLEEEQGSVGRARALLEQVRAAQAGVVFGIEVLFCDQVQDMQRQRVPVDNIRKFE